MLEHGKEFFSQTSSHNARPKELTMSGSRSPQKFGSSNGFGSFRGLRPAAAWKERSWKLWC
jgi:hypothetical protein